MIEPSPADIALFRAVFDASPVALFVVDGDVQVMQLNRAAELLVGEEDGQPRLRRRGGDLLHCLHASENPGGCGRAPACADCEVRNSVAKAMAGVRVFQEMADMQLLADGKARQVVFRVTTAPFTYEGQPLVLLALEDISELVTLRGLLPICANCKKIRDEENYWQDVEAYLQKHLDVQFTHGLCPACVKKLYPELGRKGPGAGPGTGAGAGKEK